MPKPGRSFELPVQADFNGCYTAATTFAMLALGKQMTVARMDTIAGRKRNQPCGFEQFWRAEMEVLRQGLKIEYVNPSSLTSRVTYGSESVVTFEEFVDDLRQGGVDDSYIRKHIGQNVFEANRRYYRSIESVIGRYERSGQYRETIAPVTTSLVSTALKAGGVVIGTMLNRDGYHNLALFGAVRSAAGLTTEVFGDRRGELLTAPVANTVARLERDSGVFVVRK